MYQDHLVILTEDKIIFNHYYFPAGKEKEVDWNDVEWIKVKPPTIANGKMRIHGTGNFQIWFPKDKNRSTRDRIFFAKLKSQKIEIGFTVEGGEQVETIFKDNNLITT